MLVGVLSDIHSNVKGLSRALKLLKNANAEKIVCLGDIVGYGNDPLGCLELVSSYCDLVVKGNHDYAVSTNCNLTFYSEFAKKHILKQRKILGETAKQWLRNLPYTITLDNVTFVHASVPYPEEWLYPAKTEKPENQIVFVKPKVIFNAMETRFLLVGHSHQPSITFLTPNNTVRISNKLPKETIKFQTSKKVIIDVGSVSISRNNNLSSCLLFDTKKEECKFLEFEIE
jgi:predicted phosphodiesterase